MRKNKKKRYQSKNINVNIANLDFKKILNPFMKEFLGEVKGIYHISYEFHSEIEGLKRANKVLIAMSAASLLSSIVLFFK